MAVSNTEIRSAADLRIDPRRKTVDKAMKYFFISSAVTTFIVTIAIIATLVSTRQLPPGHCRHRRRTRRTLHDRLVPTPGHVRHRNPGRRYLHRHRHRDDRRGAPRVLAPRSTCPSTPGRRSARRSSRSSRSSPACRAWCSATSRSPTSTPNIVSNLFSGANAHSPWRQRASAWASSRSRSSPRSRRMRCPLSLSHFARRPTASAPNRWQSTFKVVFPAADLRHHRRPDPRHLPSDR
jgi:hypothetical protein